MIPRPHSDPHIQAIRDRNARALAEAVHAPPPDVADDPGAFLRWAQQRPTAPPAPRPVPFGSVRPRRTAAKRASGYVPAPPRHDERNRQLDALEKLIGEQAEPTPPETRNP